MLLQSHGMGAAGSSQSGTGKVQRMQTGSKIVLTYGSELSKVAKYIAGKQQ